MEENDYIFSDNYKSKTETKIEYSSNTDESLDDPEVIESGIQLGHYNTSKPYRSIIRTRIIYDKGES